jgi:hypothetical protein
MLAPLDIVVDVNQQRIGNITKEYLASLSDRLKLKYRKIFAVLKTQVFSRHTVFIL